MLLIGFSVLIAEVLTAEIAVRKYKNSFKLDKSLYEGRLNAQFNFSQEEYSVGDTVDVTIHFEVNTTQNTKNLKFAITDYNNKGLYEKYRGLYDKIPEEAITSQKEKSAQSKAACKAITSDPDLILSNENPMGDYHITFMLTKKCPVIHAWGETHPYISKRLMLFEFTEAIPYPYITDYRVEHGRSSRQLLIPIRLHPDAQLDKKPLDTPKPASGKSAKELPAKPIPAKGEHNETVCEDSISETEIISFQPANVKQEWKYYSSTDSAENLYDLAKMALAAEDYSAARVILKSIIINHSDSRIAEFSAKELFYAGKKSEHDYLELRDFYSSFVSADYPKHLQKLCAFLLNECNRRIENYPAAIQWYIDEIENPVSFSAGIYALTDLNHTYLQLDEETRAALIDTIYCFTPLTYENYFQTSNELQYLTIPYESAGKDDVLSRSLPHLYHADITISFNLPEKSMVNLTICNAKGEAVACLINEKLKKGEQTAVWQGMDDAGNPVEAQMYAYVLKVNGTTEREKRFLLLQ
jgi:ribosomal protein L21E